MLHDEDDAGEDDGKSRRNVHEDGDGGDLDVKEDQTTPGALAESSPRIRDSGVAETANDSRLDATLEGTIEGDDGLIVSGEKGGLNTDEDDVGRDDDEDGADDGEDEDNEALGKEDSTLALGQLGHVLTLAELGEFEAKNIDEESGSPSCDFRGEPDKSDGLPDSIKGALERRQTAPEVEGRTGGNGDVNPGSAELDEGQSSEKSSDGDEDASEGGGEDAHEDVGEEGLDDEDGQTAEVGEDAAVGSEETEDGSDGRGDGLRAAAGHLGSACALLALLIVSGRGEGLVGRRVLILDDGKGRVQGPESVSGL